MLKAKSKLNYRRGGQSKSCAGCDHLVRNHPIIGIGGEDLGLQPRCKVVGLQSGRMYRISLKSVCDRWTEMSRVIAAISAIPHVPVCGDNHEAA